MGDVVQLIKNKKDRSIESILREADLVGRTEAEKTNPQMVQLKGRKGEPFPLCGFADVRVMGVRGKKLAKLKEFGFEKVRNGSGVSLYVSGYNQSYELKKAYAKGFADVLIEHGLDSFVMAWYD
jgi:hypothetical protein